MPDDDGWSNGNSFSLERKLSVTCNRSMEPYYPFGCLSPVQDRGGM